MLVALAMSSSAVMYVNSATASVDTTEPNTVVDQNRHIHSNALRVRRGPDGLFHLNVTFDGVAAKAILDTGANRTVLGSAIFERIDRRTTGRPDAVSGRGSIKTLNGKLRYTTAMISDVRAHGIALGAIDAAVVEGSDIPIILGQDAISRFASVTIRSDELILN